MTESILIILGDLANRVSKGVGMGYSSVVVLAYLYKALSLVSGIKTRGGRGRKRERGNIMRTIAQCLK